MPRKTENQYTDKAQLNIRKAKIKEIRKKFKYLHPHLNERSKRLFAAAEALALGYGGISIVREGTGLSRSTISLGCKELTSNESLCSDGVRRSGAGRKSVLESQPNVMEALKNLLESNTCGDSENLLQWTNLSQRVLATELSRKGFEISHQTVAMLLDELGYSLQGNKKAISGTNTLDRDEQFQFINRKAKRFINAGKAVISVDCKKKENVGEYKNSGRTYRPKKNPVLVKTHDFPDKKLGKVNPYGVYDIGKKHWIRQSGH